MNKLAVGQSENEYLHVSTDGGKTWCDMEDTVSTRENICRWSFSEILQVKLDNGERYEVEFGKFTRTSATE